MTPDASTLKAKHREIRARQPEPMAMRIHRAISWLARAEQEQADQDARFIFLWIALNAAYATEFGFEQSERDQTRAFLGKLLSADSEQRLHAVVFQQFTGPIRALIENKFVFEPFWRAMREHDSSGHWESQFTAGKRLAMKAVMEKQTELVLAIVLDRLYVLRNQLIHGGATWNSGANRQQVRDGVAILAALVPVIVDLMMESHTVDFSAIAYPHIQH